jgi:hypothetical protein
MARRVALHRAFADCRCDGIGLAQRCTMHFIWVVEITSESVGKEFREHAQDEHKHMATSTFT